MSKESYIRGFCKVAYAHGVDPQALANFAAEKNPAKRSMISGIKNILKKNKLARKGKSYGQLMREGKYVVPGTNGVPTIVNSKYFINPGTNFTSAVNEVLKYPMK